MPAGRAWHPTLAALLLGALAAGLAGCGERAPTGPTPPPGPEPPPGIADCHAINYAGATGGERIQNAIEDRTCGTVYIGPDGPDGGGVWLVTQSIRLRSNLTVTSTMDGRPAVLQGSNGVRMLVADGQSNIVLRRLTLAGAKAVPSGLVIIGSRQVAFTQGTIRRMNQFGIIVRDTPSFDIRVTESTFEDNGFIDVRTQTAAHNAFHANVVVEHNSMRGTTYGVAFANCGGSPAAACQARNNVVKPKRSDPGTGVDLNRSHSAVVLDNRVLGLGDACAPGVTCRCGYGITVDDTQNATISGNTIEGCTADGILLGNGAVREHRPWWLSGNMIRNNTVRHNDGAGLASFRNPDDPLDNNVFNVFRDNRIEGNAGGGCMTNAERNTFFGNGPQSCAAQDGVMAGASEARQRLQRRR